MAYKEKLGAMGDSLRIKNNEWYVGRSFAGQSDIKVFRVNELDQIEFHTVPRVNNVLLVTETQFQDLEERVAILEAIIGGITAGNTNIVPLTWTALDIISKAVILPQSPLSGTVVIIPAHGNPQVQNVDFIVTGDTLSWDGYPYEDIAEENDIVKIIYMF